MLRGPSELVSALQRVGVTLVAYLPDEWLESFIQEIERCPTIQTVRVAREDEGVGICAGAFFGGRRAALVMQNAGLLLSGNALVGCALAHQTPFLMLVSYTGNVRDPRFFQIWKGRATEPFLQALGIRYATVDGPEDATLIDDLAAFAYQAQQPAVALLLRGVLEA